MLTEIVPWNSSVIASGAGSSRAFAHPLPSARSGEHSASASSERALVFLVEDNRGDILLLREALSEHHVDAEIVVLSDGEQAINLIRSLDANPDEQCPRLVVLDLNLPKRNGHEVLSYLRHSVRCAASHVIIFSSSNADKDRDAALEEGADQYVCKPSSLNAFLEIGRTIAEALAR